MSQEKVESHAINAPGVASEPRRREEGERESRLSAEEKEGTSRHDATDGGHLLDSGVDTPSDRESQQTTPSSEVQYIQYKSELQMPDIMQLMRMDLSEPYSIYTYRYFIHKWPHLCFLVGVAHYNAMVMQ